MATTYHHGDLPRALLDATDDLIQRDGVGAVSIRAVARGVGVSHSAPLHHFGDKEGLLTAFAREGFQKFADHIEAARTSDPTADPQQRLAACGRAYIEFAMENRSSFEVMFRKELLDECDQGLQDEGGRAFATVVAAVADCLPDAAPERVEELALAAWASVHGLATLWVDGPLPSMFDCDRNSLDDLQAVGGAVLAAVGRAVATA